MSEDSSAEYVERWLRGCTRIACYKPSQEPRYTADKKACTHNKTNATKHIHTLSHIAS